MHAFEIAVGNVVKFWILLVKNCKKNVFIYKWVLSCCVGAVE